MASWESGLSPRGTGDSGNGRGRRRTLIAALSALLLSPASSWALFSDNFELWAAENLTRDSNVYRLSDLITGNFSRSDRISTTSVGATLGLPVSQQRFEAAITGFGARYQDNKNLNYNGHTARASWNWWYDQNLTGLANYNEQKSLASFSNIQSADRDLVTTRQATFTGSWMATPRWRASMGAVGVRQEHDNPARAIQDIEAASGELGLSYVSPTEDSVGAVVRVEHGRAPHDTVLGGVTFDNAYIHRSAGLTGRWVVTGHSRFDGRVEWVRRDYREFTQRNYQGPTYHASWTWTPTGKLTIVSAVQRDVGPTEDINTSFVLVKGGFVRPRWEITDKLALQGTAEYNIWSYRGDPLSLADTTFTHHVRTFGASLIYKPTAKIQLSAGATHEVRTSTLLLGGYDVNLVYIEGRVGF